MTWQPEPVAKALASALEEVSETVSVFAFPPETLNPPALVVGRPDSVELKAATFCTDQAQLPIVGFSGLDGDIAVGDLLAGARAVLEADPTLSGQVQSLRCVRYRNWAATTVAGASLLSAQLLVEVWV